MIFSRRSSRKTRPIETAQHAPAPETRVEGPPAAEIDTIDRSLEVQGDIHSDADLQIDGIVHGRIIADGSRLIVGVDGRVTANVRATTVVVRGQIDGSVVAEDLVEILPTGAVQGDIRARRVILADGATCNGRVNRTADEEIEWSQPVEIDTPAVFVPRVGHDHRPEPKPRGTERRPTRWTLTYSIE